jgi:RNA polymerase sigma-70 factor (sigma-E family)
MPPSHRAARVRVSAGEVVTVVVPSRPGGERTGVGAQVFPARQVAFDDEAFQRPLGPMYLLTVLTSLRAGERCGTSRPVSEKDAAAQATAGALARLSGRVGLQDPGQGSGRVMTTGTADVAGDAVPLSAVDANSTPGHLVAAAAGTVTPTVTQLYHAHRLSLVRLAILLVDDQATAEDVVQDAFAGLYQRWGRLIDVGKALGYLRTAVVNNARSVLRRRQTARKYVVPYQPDAASAESEAMLAAEHREVLDALNRLAPRQREVLVLRYWSEMSETEIAETLGISRGAVKSTASRAMDALEKLLETPR